jgi:hypothetical protein
MHASWGSRASRFTDPRLATGEYVRTVARRRSMPPASIRRSRDVAIRPTDASFQEAARFAADGRFDSYVSVGGSSSRGHLQGGEPLRIAAGGVRDVRERSHRRRTEGAGAGEAAHRLPYDVRHGLGDHRNRDLQPALDEREDRHHRAD